jgi:hypothetical protein
MSSFGQTRNDGIVKVDPTTTSQTADSADPLAKASPN